MALNSLPKTRRAILPLTLGLLALGIAVFGWDLHYKLSLYHSEHTIGHHWQPASLFTEGERPLARYSAIHYEPVSFTTPNLRILTVLFFALGLLIHVKLRACYTRLQSRRSWLFCVKASFSSFFFRPPPPVLSL